MKKSGDLALKILELIEETDTDAIQATAELIAVLGHSMAGMVPKDQTLGKEEILKDVIRMLTENYNEYLKEYNKD